MSKTKLFESFLSDESGATAIEYGLIAALIAVGLIIGARSISTSVNGLFTDVDSEMVDAFNSTSATSSP